MKDLYEREERKRREKQEFEQASHINYLNKLSDLSFNRLLGYQGRSASISSLAGATQDRYRQQMNQTETTL